MHLAYHFVNHAGEKKPGLSIEYEHFCEQMKFFHEQNYAVWNLSQYVQAYLSGDQMPTKVVTLSFDDGLRDHYKIVYPVLKRYGFSGSFLIIGCTLQNKLPPVIGFQALIKILGAERLEKEILPNLLAGTSYATLLDPLQYDIRDAKKPEPPEMRRIKWVFNHFLPQSLKSDLIDEMFREYVEEKVQQKTHYEYFMNGEELREMAGCGMDIVSHSYSHPDLTVMGSTDIDYEMRISKSMLEEIVRSPVTTFAWTFGGTFKDSVKKIVGKYYQSAWNFYGDFSEVPKAHTPDLFDLPRVDGAKFNLNS